MLTFRARLWLLCICFVTDSHDFARKSFLVELRSKIRIRNLCGAAQGLALFACSPTSESVGALAGLAPACLRSARRPSDLSNGSWSNWANVQFGWSIWPAKGLHFRGGVEMAG